MQVEELLIGRMLALTFRAPHFPIASFTLQRIDKSNDFCRNFLCGGKNVGIFSVAEMKIC